MVTEYEPVIGLEVHAQLFTRTKIFCGCLAAFGAPPNTHTCPTCLGLPGALPVLNAEAVRLAVRAALGLGCTIRRTSRFARKNYFYPDLPKGYQISQFDEPFSDDGVLEIEVGEGDAKYTRRARIQRVHMEEDAGKNFHDKGDESIVDLNRSGTPLVEIVGHPDLRSGTEAAEYLRALRDILVFLGVNDGNLEEGSFRCDANVSIRPKGSGVLGTRVELKNINSFKFVEKAIHHEIARQEAVLSSGGKITQETRGWSEKDSKTFSLRSKETAQDYRYFPEPDLPPLVIDETFVAEVQRSMPELPKQKRVRLKSEYPDLTSIVLDVVTRHPMISRVFEQGLMLAIAAEVEAKAFANFFVNDLLRDVTVRGVRADFPRSKDDPAAALKDVIELLRAIHDRRVTRSQAKLVWRDALENPASSIAELIGHIAADGAVGVDEAIIFAICQKIVEAHPKQADQVRAGKIAILGFFVGQVMKETKGSASPAVVNETLKKILGLV